MLHSSSAKKFPDEFESLNGSFELKLETEHELKYLLSIKHAERVIAEGTEHPKFIRQWYFPPVIEELVLAYCLAGEHQSPLLGNEQFSLARLRRITTPDGEERYYAQAKFAAGANEDLELSREVDSRQLIDFLIEKSDGVLAKLRYPIKGLFISEHGKAIQMTAELDVLLEPSIEAEGEMPSFATIDVELPSGVNGNGFRVGEHSFRFLEDALELTREENQRLRKPIRNKRLARKGFDEEAKKAVKKALKRLAA